MSKLLYVQASPTPSRSFSIAVAQAFLKAYRAKNPGDEVRVVDLFNTDLPAFDGFTLQAKYAILHGKPHTAQEKAAWQAVESVVADFKSADKFLFAVPMWNFGLPYKLKHYLDVIIQPGYTFSYSPAEGFKGLVTGKPVAVVYARGGAYAPGTVAEAMDMQKKYLELLLGFMGFKDIRNIVVEPTLMGGPETAAAKRAEAVALAEKIAKEF
ncbi:MAG TPA: NAD(P)H-dependent oxidoreductase [Candidatus Brocadiia bacterium]|nr:NAD(P)H-dependent oxidoreductase [Candidatus Brocadiia bacterium]